MPVGDFELPLSKAEVVMEGSDITLVGYGAQVTLTFTRHPLTPQTLVPDTRNGRRC